jgi:acyl-CoA thioesterase II
VDARTFLGIEATSDPMRWRLPVTPAVSTPGRFLYGGCGLAAALVALEEASGRPTVWATAQYLAHAPTGSVVDWDVVVAASGKSVTQARANGRMDGRDVLTVNAALGRGDLDLEGTWVTPPAVPAPDDCPTLEIPPFFADSVLERVDHRLARGKMFAPSYDAPGDGSSAFWARLPGHLEPSAATLAVIGDYVSGGVSHPVGLRTMGRSLDNTIRIGRLVPTEWLLCDIRMHGLANGFAQGLAHLWAEDRTLLATASQTISVRLWPEEYEPAQLGAARRAPENGP